MAQFSVTVLNVKKYGLNGHDVSFVYTITADNKETNSEPDIIKVKIQTGEYAYSVLYKIILNKGNLTIGMQNVGVTKLLFRYKERVSVQYKKPNLIFNLRNITDKDFNWNYQVEVKDENEDDRYQKDIKLIKAGKMISLVFIIMSFNVSKE